jgi:hypothetical protein
MDPLIIAAIADERIRDYRERAARDRDIRSAKARIRRAPGFFRRALPDQPARAADRAAPGAAECSPELRRHRVPDQATSLGQWGHGVD